MQWVELLPDAQTPSWLGLPNNAERVLLTTQGECPGPAPARHQLLRPPRPGRQGAERLPGVSPAVRVQSWAKAVMFTEIRSGSHIWIFIQQK